MSPLQTGKFWLIEHVGLAKDALHVHVGLLLFVGSALIFRWPIRSWKPWAVALPGARLFFAGSLHRQRSNNLPPQCIALPINPAV